MSLLLEDALTANQLSRGGFLHACVSRAASCLQRHHSTSSELCTAWYCAVRINISCAPLASMEFYCHRCPSLLTYFQPWYWSLFPCRYRFCRSPPYATLRSLCNNAGEILPSAFRWHRYYIIQHKTRGPGDVVEDQPPRLISLWRYLQPFLIGRSTVASSWRRPTSNASRRPRRQTSMR
jgi:hypothetical protein